MKEFEISSTLAFGRCGCVSRGRRFDLHRQGTTYAEACIAQDSRENKQEFAVC